MNAELLCFNGLNGDTGEYLTPPMTLAQVSNLAQGIAPDPEEEDHRNELKWRHRGPARDFALIHGLDPKDLAQTGWAVIFPHQVDPAIVEALQPLLQLRKEQATRKNETLYREITYRPGETKPQFLDRFGAGGAGAVDPANLPYYLLIVGDPHAIPYRFQYQLDVQYAVGRIDFKTAEEYRRYAEAVVNAETGRITRSAKAAYFGVANPDDVATSLSSSQLVEPLAAYTRDERHYDTAVFLREAATRAQLSELLHGPDRPAFLFTASHGMGFPLGDARQLPHGGALVCQDWPGPKFKGSIRDFYFSSEDLSADANVSGLIAMLFACYGAGCPDKDDFAANAGSIRRKQLADRAFVAELPRRLLAHPKGGALAVIGHVDRAWDCSFRWQRSERQTQTFRSAVSCLLDGGRIGAAMEYFNSRYAEVSSDLNVVLENIKFGDGFDERELAGLWTSNNDARNYALIGDPAVRLCVPANIDNSLRKDRPMMEVHATPIAETQPVAEPAVVLRTPAPEQPTQVPATEFGVYDDAREAAERLGEALQRIAKRIGEALERTVDGLTTLEVTTYTSDNIAAVTFADGKCSGARARAMTRISMDGRTLICVPEKDGKVDDELWKIHSEALDRAIVNRAEMVKLATAAITSLAGRK